MVHCSLEIDIFCKMTMTLYKINCVSGKIYISMLPYFWPHTTPMQRAAPPRDKKQHKICNFYSPFIIPLNFHAQVGICAIQVKKLPISFGNKQFFPQCSMIGTNLVSQGCFNRQWSTRAAWQCKRKMKVWYKNTKIHGCWFLG